MVRAFEDIISGPDPKLRNFDDIIEKPKVRSFDEIIGSPPVRLTNLADQWLRPESVGLPEKEGGVFRGAGAQGSWAPETLGEKLKGIRTIDVLAHLPFSPLHDYEKKGSAAAKKRLSKGEYGPGYGTMPMGEYLTIKQPETKEELEKIVTDFEEKQARGETIPASIAGGIADLPAYMAEMYAGGIGKVKSVPGALKFAGKMTAMQPHRIQSALIDQIDRGEKGGMALAKAWGDVYIENLSETAGAGFGKAVSKLPFGGKMMEGMRKFAKSIGISDSEFWKRAGTKVGYNGLLGEWGEERIGTYLRGLFGVQDFGAGKNATFDQRIAAGFEQDFQARNMLIETGVLLAPGAVKYAGQKILGPEPGRKTPYEPEPGQQEVIPPISEAVDTSGLPAITDEKAPVAVVEPLKAEAPPTAVKPAAATVTPPEAKQPWKTEGEVKIKGTPQEKNLVEDFAEGLTTQEWKAEYRKGELPHWMTDKEPSPLSKELNDDLEKEGIKQANILEIGTGNGRDSIFLAKQGHTATGIDVAEQAVSAAKKNAGKLKNITFEKGNVEKLKYPDESFDAVFSIAALHSSLLDESLGEIHRVLKPGGIAKIHQYTKIETAGKTIHYWKSEQIKELAKKAGFSVLESHTTTKSDFVEVEGVREKIKQDSDIIVYTIKKVSPEAEEKKPTPSQDPYDIFATKLERTGAARTPKGIDYKIVEPEANQFIVERVTNGNRETIVGMRGQTFESRSQAMAWARSDAKLKDETFKATEEKAEQPEVVTKSEKLKVGDIVRIVDKPSTAHLTHAAGKTGEIIDIQIWRGKPNSWAIQFPDGEEFIVDDIRDLQIPEGKADEITKEETITEPKPSIEEQQRKARPTVSLEPTGELDPTKPEDAAKIIEEARNLQRGRDTPFAHAGIYKLGMVEGESVITEVIYSHEQVDQAYRTLQIEIESPQDDVSLFAMPGKEKELGAIGAKMATMKKLSEKKKQPSIGKTKQLFKAKTKKEDFIYAIQKATAKETSRYAISGVLVEGDNLVTTDGRRMFMAKGKWGKDGIYTDNTSLRKGVLGKADKSGMKFPKWQDIIPDISNEKAITISYNAINNELPMVWRRLHQAASLTTEESKGVLIILNKDGSLGFAASAPEVGHTEINVQPGGKILGAANPRFLMDALDFHAIRGDETVNFYFPFPDRPIFTTSPDGKTRTVTMPVKTGQTSEELQKALESRIEVIAGEKPKPKPTGGGAIGDVGGETGRIKVSMEPAGKVQTATEIVTYIERAFNIPMRGVATHHKKYAGWFDPKAVGIRLKDVRKLTTAMHEIGHHIDWTLNNRLSKNPPNADMAKELMALGKALYGSIKPPGGYKSEGFAEFIREYLTGDEAVTKAPAVSKWFAEDYLPDHRDIDKKLNITKKMITNWRLQGAEARIESQISRKPAKGTMFERIKRSSLWAERAFRSELEPIRRAMGRSGIKEGEMRADLDPYQIAVGRADKAGAIARFFVENYTTDLAGNRTGKGLKEIVKPVAKDIKAFTRWIVAAQARIYHKKGLNPGISGEDANYTYEKYDNPQWQETLKEITEWNHRLLDYLVEAGGMEKKTRAIIEAANPIYIPFMREFLEGELNVGKGAGKGVAGTAKAVKKRKGSGRAVIDPFESMIQQAAKIIGVAHKTEVAVALARLADKKGTGGMIWKVPAPTQATQFEAEQLKKEIARIAYERMGLDPDEISSAMLEHWDEILTVYSNASQYYGKDNIVSFVIDGKRQFYEVEPNLYRAIQGLDLYTLPKFWNFTLGKPTRALRLGATGLNAPFGLIRNFARDAMTFTVLSKHAKAGPLSAVGGIAADVFRTPGAQKFKALGGKMSAQILADRRALQHLEKEILVSTIKGKVVYTVAHPVDALRELFGVTEAGTRIGEFIPALRAAEEKYGKGSVAASLYALNAAQDVTTNFSRHGQIGKVLNQTIPFFNAAIQGPDKILRTLKERPGATLLKAIASLTIPAIWLWWRSKDEEWYKEMPPYERNGYLHFRIPGTDTIIRLPVPFELGHIFQSAPVAALDAKYRKDPKLVTEMLSESLRQANPSDWPAVAGPIADVIANRDFAGRPIVPASVEGMMPEDQYKIYTSRLMKLIGKTIGYSPAKLEYLVNSYSGGLYSRVSRSFDLASKKEITLSDWPVLGTLFMRESYAPKQSLQRFYERTDVLDRKYQSDKASIPEMVERKGRNKARTELSSLWKQLQTVKDEKGRKHVYMQMAMVVKQSKKPLSADGIKDLFEGMDVYKLLDVNTKANKTEKKIAEGVIKKKLQNKAYQIAQEDAKPEEVAKWNEYVKKYNIKTEGLLLDRYINNAINRRMSLTPRAKPGTNLIIDQMALGRKTK